MSEAASSRKGLREKVSIFRNGGNTITVLSKSFSPLNVHADNPIWAKLDEGLREKGK